MKNILFVFIIISASLKAQPNYLISKNFDLANWEVAVGNTKKLGIVQKLYTEYELEMLGEKLKNKLDYFHFGYINNDSLLDLIYSGFFFSEGRITRVFINEKNKYNEVLIAGGEIVEMNHVKNNSLPEFKFFEAPCCEGEIYTIYTYRPNVTTEKDAYSLSETLFYHRGTKFPIESESTISKKFKVKNKEYYLRFTPVIDNTDKGKYKRGNKVYSYNKGNIVGNYANGDIGTAFAEKLDDTGRVWWFVKMYNKHPYSDVNFPPKGSYSMGWMSSRYLEISKK